MIKTTCVSRIPEYARAHRGDGHHRRRRRRRHRRRRRPPLRPSLLARSGESCAIVPDRSEARYSFALRRGCFLLRRWCVTRRRKKDQAGRDRRARWRESEGVEGGNGKRRVIGRFRALCRSPRLRGCVCATLFAQQLEAGISSPRKSPPHAAQVRKGEKDATRRDTTRCAALRCAALRCAAFPPSWT